MPPCPYAGDTAGTESSTIKTWITNTAQGGDGFARYMARYFLAVYEGIYMQPEAFIIEETGGRSGREDAIQPFVANNVKNGAAVIYPNPVGNNLNIEMSGYENELLAEIYDVTGRKLIVQRLAGNDRTHISTEQLSPGSYILKITDKGKTLVVHRIVKQ